MKRQIMAMVCAIVIAAGCICSSPADAAAKQVSLSQTSITLKAGESRTITVKKAKKVTIKKKTFTSSNNDVAFVTKAGKVTAKKEGKVSIKVAVNYKKGKKTTTKTLKCNVTVTGNSAAGTDKPGTTPETPSSYKDDEEALKHLIAEQRALGATVSDDLYSNEYEWIADGVLGGIFWDERSISGDISFASFKRLRELECSMNDITSLDVSNNTDLTRLVCYANNLTSLDVTNNTALTYLYCSDNSLESLDVTNNTALTDLLCTKNNLTSLDVSNITGLKKLSCSNNSITSLDVSKNTELRELVCYNNNLSSLDVSNNINLVDLYCSSNNITTIDVTSNINLTGLDCDEGITVIGYDGDL